MSKDESILSKKFCRHASIEDQKMLSIRLGFVWMEDIQDWDLVFSDSERLEEFVKIYKTEDLNDSQKFALMELIVASFDDLVQFKGDFGDRSNLWNECKHILIHECWLHICTILYWCLLEKSDLEDSFPITKFMRPIWEEVKLSFLG